MKQSNILKMMAVIATGILSFMTTGCSSDKFYGFDDSEWNLFYEIAHSKEYTDYLIAVCEFRDSIVMSVDRAPDIIQSNDTLKSYGVKVNLPYGLLNKKTSDLIASYPEYSKLKIEDRQNIFLLLVKDCPSLAAELRFSTKSLIRTKSGNPESDASQAMSYANWSGSQWNITEMSWTQAVARCRSACSGDKEYGGYAFCDGSGMFIDDSMTETSYYYRNGVQYVKRVMHMPVWDWHSNVPIFSFHCHPDQDSTNISMSDYDWCALAAMNAHGCNLMLILASDCDYTWRLEY